MYWSSLSGVECWISAMYTLKKQCSSSKDLPRAFLIFQRLLNKMNTARYAIKTVESTVYVSSIHQNGSNHHFISRLLALNIWEYVFLINQAFCESSYETDALIFTLFIIFIPVSSHSWRIERWNEWSKQQMNAMIQSRWFFWQHFSSISLSLFHSLCIRWDQSVEFDWSGELEVPMIREWEFRTNWGYQEGKRERKEVVRVERTELGLSKIRTV